jgi:type III pantothenate kinase
MRRVSDANLVLTPSANGSWLAILCGNSRNHWAVMSADQQPLQCCDTQPDELITDWLDAYRQDCWLASVVPSRTPALAPWQPHLLQLADLPLRNLYPSCGIDRALALMGAGHHYGWPVLVIDAGTALSLTAAGPEADLVGGAILPGLRLQARSLAIGTAVLPALDWAEQQGLSERWACSTEGAIASGILYTVLAGLRDYCTDWQRRYPDSPMVLTGGDGAFLYRLLADQGLAPLHQNDWLAFLGMAQIRAQTGGAPV